MKSLIEVYQEVEQRMDLSNTTCELHYFTSVEAYQSYFGAQNEPFEFEAGKFIVLVDVATNEVEFWHEGAALEDVLTDISLGYFSEHVKEGYAYFDYGKNEKVKALYTALDNAKLEPHTGTTDVLYYRSAQDFVDFIDKDALPRIKGMQLYYDMRGGAETPDFMKQGEFVLVYDFDMQEYLGFNEKDTLAEVNAAIQNHDFLGQAFNSLKPPCKAKELER